MSPIGAGWADGPNDFAREAIGQDFYAQAEAKRIIEHAEPWPMAEIPIRDLDHAAQAALMEAAAILITNLP